MKFTLSTSGHFYPEADRRQKLESLGFQFDPSEYKGFIIKGSPEIEINSLQELIEFTNKYGEIIVCQGSIEIYDDYRE